MTDNKLTDEQIMKALECCLHSGERCNKCELNGFHDCIALHPKDILDLINRQKAEIEMMRNYIHDHNLEWDLLSYSKRNGG